MNFSNLKEWTTPRGDVVELAINGKIAWKKVVGVPISTLPVGSSVYMDVSGVRTEFLVIHQGLPSFTYDFSSYDTSCDGTWLLMKDIYEKRIWDSVDNDYENSDIHSYLNNTFVNLFDSNIKSVIKQVKLPYANAKGSLVTGSNGISTKIFLLSATEADISQTYMNLEGGTLSYFSTDASLKRIAYFNETATGWWFRSPRTSGTTRIWCATSDGFFDYKKCTESYGVRPALILPSETLVDGSGNVIA